MIEGITKPAALVDHAVSMGMPAVALADRGNLFGLMKFSTACRHKGIKGLVACDIRVAPDSSQLLSGDMLLLVCNDEGYANLIQLISKAHLEPDPKDGKPCIKEAWLDQYREGLLVLSGACTGTIGKLLANGKEELARQWLRHCRGRWGDDFYIEIQRSNRVGEEAYVQQALKLAADEGAPVVATHDVCFLRRDNFAAHETRVAIQGGWVLNDPRRPRLYSEEQYMKSPQEMAVLFADVPNALVNTVEIAKRCNFYLNFEGHHLPKYQDDNFAGESEEEMLQRLAMQGLERRCRRLVDSPDAQSSQTAYKWEDYLERLRFEIDVINSMGFAGYFLIVMEFVSWAKQNAIPVGPGRGSGAGSLVAYAIDITDINPLEYDLLFERFLNPERQSLPDFDIDFCIDGRDRVIEHVVERYGKQAVSQIITFGTMAARGVVRDITRVQGKPYGLGDRLAKMIPGVPDTDLRKSITADKALRAFIEEDEAASEIIEMAYQLEGLVRNQGKHPGGVVIAPGLMSEYVPVTLDEHGLIITQFDKKDVESAGLVKFDFLGLRTLTVINHAISTINKRHPEAKPIVAIDIPLDDSKVYEMLQRADTTGVFQLESRGMRQLIRELKPTKFADMAAVVALYRPASLQHGMSQDFIKRRGGQKFSYPHPTLAAVLEPTYGVIVYQEQVMQIAGLIAGYSLGDADILRRTLEKSGTQEGDLKKEQQRLAIIQETGKEFVDSAVKYGVIKAKKAQSIFDFVVKFGGYGFNRSHSVGYALIAYQTAWLKCHYPAEFMAAIMSSEMQDTDRLMNFLPVCRAMQLTLSLPDINRSEYHFNVFDDNTILYGLGAIKGIGREVVEGLVAARQQGGAYQDLFDLCYRQISNRMNKKSFEALIKAGALDPLPVTPMTDSNQTDRAAMLAQLENAHNLAEQKMRDEKNGLADLFAEVDDGKAAIQGVPGASKPWSKRQQLLYEYGVMGLYLDEHLISIYEQELQQLGVSTVDKLDNCKGQKRTMAGVVVNIRRHRMKDNKRGKGSSVQDVKVVQTMAFLELEARESKIEVSLPPALFEQHGAWLKVNQVVAVTGKVEAGSYSDSMRVQADSLQSIEMMRNRQGLWAVLNSTKYSKDEQIEEFVTRLRDALQRHRGEGCCLQIQYRSDKAWADIKLGNQWMVNVTDECLDDLRDIFGVDNICLGPPQHSVAG